MLKTGAVGLIECGVNGLNGISLDIDKLCKYAGENEEYMEALQEIIDMLGAHGALLTFEVEEVLTPERFEEIGRLCREINLDAILKKGNELIEGGIFTNAAILGIDETYGRYDKNSKKLFVITVILAVIELLPQIFSDINDDNNTIDNKTIEDISRTAFELSFSYVGSKVGSIIGYYAVLAIFPPGAVIGYVMEA